jgi:hypothetical protein
MFLQNQNNTGFVTTAIAVCETSIIMPWQATNKLLINKYISPLIAGFPSSTK